MFYLFIGLLLLGQILALPTANEDYYGYKIIEVQSKSNEDFKLLKELEKQSDIYDFLSSVRVTEQTARIIVSPTYSANLTNLLTNHKLEFHIINDNLGHTLDEEFAQNEIDAKSIVGKHRLSTSQYYSHEEINNYLEELARDYPDRVYVRTVGFSYEKRAMKTITITNGDKRKNKNVIVVDGGIHAREWISPPAVIYMIEQLVEHFAQNEDLLKDYDWVILPVVNPDGYEYSRNSRLTRMWRKTRKPSSDTCYGTDANRNFGYHWKESGASSDPCDITYAGPNAFSEPEVVVLRDLLLSNTGRGKMYLTMHSYGSLILYPWGYTELYTENKDELQEIAAAARDAIKASTGREYQVGMSTITIDYAAAGASDDYAYSIGYPIVFTMELPAGGTGFDPPASEIDGTVTETWVGVRTMAEKTISKYPLKQ